MPKRKPNIEFPYARTNITAYDENENQKVGYSIRNSENAEKIVKQLLKTYSKVVLKNKGNKEEIVYTT